MISDFWRGGDKFSKIGESLCKKAFSIGGKSEIGGGGVENDSKKWDIIYEWPQRRCYMTMEDKFEHSGSY